MVIEGVVLDKPAPNIELSVGLRTYLEIVKVEAPSEASYGDTVSINIYVRNKWTYRIFAIVTGSCDGIELVSGSHWIWPDAQRIFGFSFTMPNKSVDLWIWAWYWTEDGWSTSPDDEYGPVKIDLAQWALLDSTTIAVAVTAPPPVGWQLLDTATVMVSPTAPPPVGWQPLDSTTVSITAGPISPKYELIQHVISPWGYFYEGDAEVASISFTLIKGTTWLAIDMANNFADELEARGSKLLDGEFYKDASSIIQDRYLVKISYVVPTGVSGVGAIGVYIPPIVWTIIFYAAIGALIAFLVSHAVNWVKSIFYSPPPLSEEVKAQWSRETLTSMIIDLRPEYSPEELAGKTDQGLRDLLNEIYEEEVPPRGIPWWGWAILGGVAIAGGALAFRFISPLLPKRKEEKK